MKKNEIVKFRVIQERIFTMRGLQVILDSDLAKLYEVETKVFNQAIRRNIERFPNEFMFQLTPKERDSLRSQIVTLKKARGQHRKYLPYVFTEQGVAMLAGVLKSRIAVRMSIQIINAFVAMRRFIAANSQLLPRLENLEKKQIMNEIKTEEKFNKVFKALEGEDVIGKQGIFYNGQVFDAYKFISDIIRKAKKSIVLIDNYVDDTVLTLLDKRKKNISATIFTSTISKQLSLDIEKHNLQYDPVEIKIFKKSHDRFLIIDNKNLYHIGASLKDLGNKWFAFSKMNKETLSIMEKIK